MASIWPAGAVAAALSYIRLLPDDLRLRDDYVERDGCRLDLVDRLMRDPAAMPEVLHAFSAAAFDHTRQTTPAPTVPIRITPLAQLALSDWPSDWAHRLSADSVLPRPVSALPLPADWKRFLTIAMAASDERDWIDSVCAGLDLATRLMIRDTLPELLREDASDKDKSPEALDAMFRREDSLAQRFAAMSDSLNWRWVWTQGAAILDTLLASLPHGSPVIDSADWPRAMRRIAFGHGDTLVVGTLGPDVYVGAPSLILDPGGDDLYRLAPVTPGRPSLIVDWSGDDIYDAPSGRALGCGYWSWSLLIDCAGNDTYDAGSFSLGAGWFGAGALIDRAGDDAYRGDTHTQGAGGFGIGVLCDESGTDQYTGRLFSQGFGFAAGLGILSDYSGNDNYTSGGLYEDVLRYRDHYLSLSQGFGYGIRPHCSGGVGLLLDGSGNDVYTADIFGQGASYWWAYGGLYDASGNDHYQAYQYAQGSATHMTAGCLYDRAGDDTYFAKGVSQGCGHDWSAGLLIDRGGNDTYAAADLSQGAGSANGVGVLIDQAGNDAYSVESGANTQGYGNPRREYGSVGLFLDLGGADRYLGPGSDGRIWLGGSRWGVGVDADSAWMNRRTELSEKE